MEILWKRSIRGILLFLMGCVAVCFPLSQEEQKLIIVEGENLRCGIDPASGLPAWLESRARPGHRVWLNEPIHVAVRNEVNEVSAHSTDAKVNATVEGGVTVTARLEPLQLRVTQQWTGTPSGLLWDLSFDGSGKRDGHEVTIDLPLLSPDVKIFTPSNDGIIAVATLPTYRPVPTPIWVGTPGRPTSCRWLQSWIPRPIKP